MKIHIPLSQKLHWSLNNTDSQGTSFHKKSVWVENKFNNNGSSVIFSRPFLLTFRLEYKINVCDQIAESQIRDEKTFHNI